MYAMTQRWQIPAVRHQKYQNSYFNGRSESVCSMAVIFLLLLYPSVKREMDFSLFIHDITQNANLTEQEWTQFMGKNLLEFIT